MRRNLKTGTRRAFGATVLVAIFLAGMASYRAWSPESSKPARPVARAKEKRESDMPPPGFLRERWGYGTGASKVEPALLAPTASSAVSNWIPIGPTQMTDVDSNTILEPSQGRVNCVAVSPNDPNRILIGAGSGGVWLSTDGGQNWSPRTDHLPVLGVADIEFSNDPNIVYMATGDGIASATPSIGVYKSTDGGVSWNPTGLVFDHINDFRIIRKLAVHPTDPNTVYAVESNGLYKTTNGGTNWQFINPSGVIGGDFPMYDVKLKPNDPATVYAMSADGAFRRSTNSGASWEPIPPGLPSSSAVRRCQIAVTPFNSDVVYVICSERSTNGLNGVYLSTNGGSSFSATAGTGGALTDFGNQATYDMSIAASPGNASDVCIGGVLPLRSNNAGGSWSPITGFGSYTGIVRGVNNGTGNGLVEAYNLQ